LPGAGQPFLHPPGTRIVGSGRQPEIAELVAQLGQKLRRLRQGLHRIEGIEQSALARCPRHELRNALRAAPGAGHRTDGVGLKAALLPDHPREKFQRQAIRPRRGLDHQADGVGGTTIRTALDRRLRDCELFDARVHVARLIGCERHGVVGERWHRGKQRRQRSNNSAKAKSHCGPLSAAKPFILRSRE